MQLDDDNRINHASVRFSTAEFVERTQRQDVVVAVNRLMTCARWSGDGATQPLPPWLWWSRMESGWEVAERTKSVLISLCCGVIRLPQRIVLKIMELVMSSAKVQFDEFLEISPKSKELPSPQTSDLFWGVCKETLETLCDQGG